MERGKENSLSCTSNKMGSESSSFGRLTSTPAIPPGSAPAVLPTWTIGFQNEFAAWWKEKMASPTLLVICTEASLFSELTAPFPCTLAVGAECLKLLWMTPGHICKESSTQAGDLAGRSKRKDRFTKNPSLLASQNQTRSPPPRLP